MNIYDNKPNLGDDSKPYTTLGYANGLGGINGTRENLTGVDTEDKDFLQQATVMRYKETHGLEDVGEFFNVNCFLFSLRCSRTCHSRPIENSI